MARSYDKMEDLINTENYWKTNLRNYDEVFQTIDAAKILICYNNVYMFEPHSKNRF